jgi:hypothetical protein
MNPSTLNAPRRLPNRPPLAGLCPAETILLPPHHRLVLEQAPSLNQKKNLFHSWTSVARLEWLIYEEFFALLGGAGAMRPDGMRRWEGGTWSI